MTFDITKTKHTLMFRSGLRIELDASEIYPNDPGQGTPAMAYYRGKSATFDAAAETFGILNGKVCEELDSAVDSVWAWVEYHTDRISAVK